MRLFHWIRAQFIEILILLFIACLRVGTFFSKERTAGLHLQARPILLVHGYLHAGFVWSLYKKRLVEKGFGPVYTIDLGSPFHSIHDYAKKIQQKAEQIARETGRSDLTLIGHSMGGLVSAFYASVLAPSGTISQVITLGSPLKGTHLARLGIGRCAREMQIGSDFTKELNQTMEKVSSQIRFYHVASKTDQIVIPYGSSLVTTDPERHLIFENLGHVTLLFSPRVIKKVFEWLSDSK